MKKLLLLTLALVFGAVTIAQKTYQVKPGLQEKQIKMEEQQQQVAEPDFTTLPAGPKAKAPVPPANTDNTQIVTIVDIGSSANIYTYGYLNGNATYVWYNEDLNAVSNLHRMGGAVGPPGQYSGDLSYDISFDGGNSWTNQIKVYESNISGGQYNTDAARYPQGAIYNPAGNTDPANAYMSFFAATLDGSNGDSWGGYGYGVGNLADIEDTVKHILSADLDNGFYQGIPTAYTITRGDGISIMADASLLDSYTEYLGDLIFMRGVFDPDIGDYEYEEFLVPAPAEYARYLKTAFDPSGQIGYVFWAQRDGSIPAIDDQEWYYPLLVKSEDAGETWGDVISVELSGPDGIDGIKNWLTDEQLLEIWEDPVPDRDDILYATYWVNTDIAVDAWGNPHLAAMVLVVGPGLDPGFYIGTDFAQGIFDIYSIDDDNENWQAVHLGNVNHIMGDFIYPGSDPLSEANRVGATATSQGDYMFFTWMDTRLEGVEENTAPDIYARGFDIVGNAITNDESSTAINGATNVTAFSEAMWQAYFKCASHYAIVDGGTFTVPIVYADMDPQDVTQPVQFKYIQDFSFAEGDFTLPTGNDPITQVSVEELETSNIATVSQNYPNPFNNSSIITVNLKESSDLRLVVTNLIGQQVMEIDRGEVGAGSHQMTINANGFMPGIYFYTVISGNSTVTRKMIIE